MMFVQDGPFLSSTDPNATQQSKTHNVTVKVHSSTRAELHGRIEENVIADLSYKLAFSVGQSTYELG
jgi:hypothetical protein